MKVLLGQEIHPDAMNLLKDNGFDIVVSPSPEDKVVRQHIEDAEGIIVRTATKLSRETIMAAKRLKVIGRTGAGVDNVDVGAASERNIPVCNAPEANTYTVAEHAACFMLALAKDLKTMDEAVRGADWGIRNNYTPVDLDSKILGLVGFGKIGRATARICSAAFNMKIIAYDPYLPEKISAGFRFDMANTLEEVFEKSDFISLHIPYNEKNHHLVDKKMLSKMKRSSFIINTSRGGIIDEPALAEAIKQGQISGAALDVFENEPPERNNPLLKLDKVILSPHSAALTKESSSRMAAHAVQGVIDVLKNREPQWAYNRNEISL
ncbi:MAG: hydroxyacid dehydrogenase [Actinomycetota bacterium]